jgi:hypothetical protein
MFSVPGLVFGGSEGVGSRFHVLRSRTRFMWYRGSRVPLSCLCARTRFGGTEGDGSCFHVLRSRTHFRRYRGRWLPFSCFALPDTFSEVPRASGAVFMFCAAELVFVGTDGVGSRFHVLRARTHFRRYRRRPVPFLCFALPDSFSAVPRASAPVFMFCAPGHFFCRTNGVGSCLHVLRARTRFMRYRRRRAPSSYFALPDTFSSVRRTSGPIFMFCAPGYVFDGTDNVGSCLHVLHTGTHFRRYRRRRVPFSCFALPDTFSAVRKASGPVYMFYAP